MTQDMSDDKKRNGVYNMVKDASELKRLALAASLTKGARRLGSVVYNELRVKAARNIKTARSYDRAFANRIWFGSQ